jgi:anion-transporting  ArsA/GET3 family ATPase
MSDIPGLPYKGLNPYSEADEPLFFGRETDTENIIDNLEVRRLTIFYGDSGVGKSSVLRAGVAHQLRQRTLENLQKYKMPQSMVVVFPPDPPASEQDNDGTYFSWQDEPMTALKQQIEKDILSTAITCVFSRQTVW